MKFNNEIKFKITRYIQDGNLPELKTYLETLNFEGSANNYETVKFIKFLDCYINNNLQDIKFNVFKIGNSKLPFLNFSTLPIVTCEGSGSCENYCYSLKAWRYPSAFYLQARNTLLMDKFHIVENQFTKIINLPKFKKLEKIDFRLYVDGDFKTLKDCLNWFNLMKDNLKVNFYGYSKSFGLLGKLSNYSFPSNYKLNISNGSKYDNDIKLLKIIQDLPITRGKFTAVKVSKDVKQVGKFLKETLQEKIFPCQGSCGSCSTIGHLCGSDIPVTIAIPIH
jgi:hypothetical protein